MAFIFRFPWRRLGRIGDFTEAEATEVIDRLSAAGDSNGIHNRCGLLLYFALFRDIAPSLPRIGTAMFKKRLHEELRNGKFRTSLVWQMSGGADGDPYPYNMIQPYLDSFISGEYCDAGFLHLRRICAAYVKEHGEQICPLIVRALARAAEYISAEPDRREWHAYDLDEFLDLLVAHCQERCVLEGVDLLASYKSRIPQLSGRKLAAILGKYESSHAKEIQERHRAALGA